MVLLLLLLRREKDRRTCYFCHDVDLTMATYNGICTWHQCKITLRLFLLFLRAHHFCGIWRMVRWGL